MHIIIGCAGIIRYFTQPLAFIGVQLPAALNISN